MEVIYKRQPKSKPIERQDGKLYEFCHYCGAKALFYERYPAKLVYTFICGTYVRLFFKQRNWAESTRQSKVCSKSVFGFEK